MRLVRCSGARRSETSPDGSKGLEDWESECVSDRRVSSVECKVELGAEQARSSMPFPVWSTTGEWRIRQQGLGRECEPGTIELQYVVSLALMAFLLFTEYCVTK